jgi:hypothetical protein
MQNVDEERAQLRQLFEDAMECYVSFFSCNDILFTAIKIPNPLESLRRFNFLSQNSIMYCSALKMFHMATTPVDTIIVVVQYLPELLEKYIGEVIM